MKNFILTFFCLTLAISAMGQVTVTGNVVDSKGEGIPGAMVVELGTTNGTATDIDGNFQLEVSSKDATLEISSAGSQSQEVQLNGRTTIKVTLQDETMLTEVVAIGYGVMSKEKLTGSVATVGQKDLNKGIAASAMSQISGKVAGVNITPTSGRAGDGPRIRVRGGASLNASNDPLIVIDGLPVSNSGISGQTNPLTSLNPNDIESYTILRDASATAIYGSRASNGVIIITTKKGTDKKVKVEFTSTNSVATIARKVNVLSGDEMKALVDDYKFYKSDGTLNFDEMARYIGYLGYTEDGVKKFANTNWQNEIYRPAFATDNALSISGRVPHLPYRVCVGYLNQDGILKTDNVQRVTGSVGLNPSFFKGDLLSFNINLKGAWTKSHFGDDGAIGPALRMDPTKPATSTDSKFDQYNHYWQWLPAGGGAWNSMVTENPLSILNSRDNSGSAARVFGNFQADYKMHFCPDLRANINLGLDYVNAKGYNDVMTWRPNVNANNRHEQYDQKRLDLLLEAYLAYAKDFGKNHFDIMGGYTYQSWTTTWNNYNTYKYDNREVLVGQPQTFPNDKTENVLISFYGRANYSWADKYLIQASIRTDASSRFGPEHRWGIFPAASAAWRINKENFLKESKVVSDLKLRLGWGMTGQQEIGNYEYLTRYSMSTNSSMVQFGDTCYNMWRPEKYDPNRKWEATTTYNVGIDYGFLEGKIYGAIDLYYKYTTDLLSDVDLPIGSNFGNKMVKNIGAMSNKGIELSFNYIPVDSKDWTVNLGFNFTINKTKIEKLTLNDTDYEGMEIGGVSGTGNNIQIHSIGYAPFTFYLREQVYDDNGNPIEKEYVDQNGDGIINDDDRVRSKSPEPLAFLGINANVRWKQLTLSTSLRSSLGNYIYNDVDGSTAIYSQILNSNSFLQNSTTDIYKTGFVDRQIWSNYYLQNASYLKMDYVSLSYDFGELVKPVNLALNFTVQNVFTVTKYTGIDPEVAGARSNGIDNNIYPYPRTFSLGLKLTF